MNASLKWWFILSWVLLHESGAVKALSTKKDLGDSNLFLVEVDKDNSKTGSNQFYLVETEQNNMVDSGSKGDITTLNEDDIHSSGIDDDNKRSFALLKKTFNITDEKTESLEDEIRDTVHNGITKTIDQMKRRKAKSKDDNTYYDEDDLENNQFDESSKSEMDLLDKLRSRASKKENLKNDDRTLAIEEKIHMLMNQKPGEVVNESWDFDDDDEDDGDDNDYDVDDNRKATLKLYNDQRASDEHKRTTYSPEKAEKLKSRMNIILKVVDDLNGNNEMDDVEATDYMNREESIIEKLGGKAFADKFERIVEENKCLQCKEFSKAHKDATIALTDFLSGIPDLEYDDFASLVKIMRQKVQNSVMINTVNCVLVNKNKDWEVPMIMHSDLMKVLNDDDDKPTKKRTNRMIHALGKNVDIDPFQSPVRGMEKHMDYFREDVFLNVLHDIWHQMNAVVGFPKEDKSERFGWFHKQLTFRYLTDRFLMGIPIPQPFDVHEQNFDTYYRSVLPWNETQYKVNNKDTCSFPSQTVTNLTLERDTVLRISVLRDFFDQLELTYHDNTHNAIAEECVQENPENATGFQGFQGTSARQPIFYRLHQDVQIIGQTFQNRRKYTPNEVLPAMGYSIKDIKLRSACRSKSSLRTYMKRHSFKTKKGFDFTYTRLEHEEFVLEILVDNPNQIAKRVMLRIFLVLEVFKDTAKWNIEMDRRVVDVPQSKLVRIKWKSTHNRFTTKDFSNVEFGEIWTWHCGWPHHMYLPKSIRRGARFRFVVFLHDVDPDVDEGFQDTPHMACGLPVQGFKRDPRDMGFPFDRSWTGLNIKDMMDHKIKQFGRNTKKVKIYHLGLRRGGRDICMTPQRRRGLGRFGF